MKKINYLSFFIVTCLTSMGSSAEEQKLIDRPLTNTFFRDCPACPEMAVIPPGNFEMGTDDGKANERPAHQVSIKQAFALGRTEVTQGQWKLIMGNNPSKFKKCGDTCPVDQVSWDNAQKFIQKLSSLTGKQYRLPTEAEWEYAARAGSTTAYPWGDQASHEYANYGKDECCGGMAQGRDKWVNTSPAGSFPPNAFGLYDMIGNVWEWTDDGYHDSYVGAPTDGGTWPGYSTNRSKHVLRGGSWYYFPQYCRVTFRTSGESYFRGNGFGFRLAQTLP